MSRWFRNAKPHVAMVAAEEEQHLRDVERALLKLLDDDIVGADAILDGKESTYHCLGRGMSKFIASMLSAEKESLAEAASLLLVAESKAWEDMKKAQKEEAAFKSTIYPPGTEYLLCYSVAQLTSALCVVLSGNVTEAIKAFYKLRKAFLTVEGIMMGEPASLAKKSDVLASKAASLRSVRSTRSSIDSGDFYSAPSSQVNSRETSPVRKSRPEAVSNPAPAEPRCISPAARGRVASLKSREASPAGWGRAPELTRRESSPFGRSFDPPSRAPTPLQRKQPPEHRLDPDDVDLHNITPETMFDNATDVFIYSGTRLCYGLLLLVFSMITNPIFTRILSVVGFKGNRELGVRLLWQTTTFHTFNSAIAAILLFGYYNVMVFSDILPTDEHADEDLAGYPKARCQALLQDMTTRYPNSKLWKMEEARMHASNRNLALAVAILAENSKHASLKQLESITVFELAFHTAFMHDYPACADAWLRCNEVSSWSPCLYAYMAAAAYLELYRDHRAEDGDQATAYRELATRYFTQAPSQAGKNRVMTKQIPFDVFCVNKIKGWEARAKTSKCSLVDAIGVSPLTEMVYFWNGMKKMNPAELERSLAVLAWERVGAAAETIQADIDERAVQTVLRASVLRHLGRTDEARQCLLDQVLSYTRSDFHPTSWTSKNAPYEMACLAWTEKDLATHDETRSVVECADWLERLQHGPESFVLDTRLAFKITISLLTVRRHQTLLEMASAAPATGTSREGSLKSVTEEEEEEAERESGQM